jgi:hypothetical protein
VARNLAVSGKSVVLFSFEHDNHSLLEEPQRRDQLDLEFRKHFEHNRFDTDGGRVAEELVDERINLE